MPFSKSEKKAKKAMEKEYGKEKGDQVLYASINKGKFGAASKARHARKKGKK
jgi:hypothetical protein